MFNKIMAEKYYCGLDIGTQKVKVGILKIKDPADMEFIGAYEHKIHGFRDNAVSDISEFSECIHHTIDQLTKKTGVKFKDVQLGLGSAMINTRYCDTVIPLIDRGNKIITSRDVRRLNNNARLLGIKIEEEILHDLPQYYRVDDVNSALNPVGLYGRKLGVHSLMVITNGNRIRNITKAVHQAGYDVENVFFNGLTTSQIMFGDNERKQGCVFVDVGSQYTTVMIYVDGILQFIEKINTGGNDLTRRIAEKINLPFDLAEEIKKSYATASGADIRYDEEILIKKEDGYIPIKHGVICEAVAPDVDALIDGIVTVLQRSELKGRIHHGITMTGGGALLSGFIEKLGNVTGMQVRLGQVNLPLRKNLSYVAIFSSVVGLAQGGFKKTLRYSLASNGHARWSKRIAHRVRELYHEYF